MTEISEQSQTFADLAVSESVVAALAEHSITHPFPIQQLAIPIALSGADMIGQARTGTGKTFAYGIPAVEYLLGLDDQDDALDGTPRVLVVTPTRELAIQVTNDLRILCASQLRILTVYGGVGYDEQRTSLKKGVDIVVGTPGRLLDLSTQGNLDFSKIHVFVLDEADEMLDLGFLPDVERIVAKLPDVHQTLLFSATMPAQIVSLAKTNLKQPVHVRAEGNDAQATVPDTTQFVYQAHDLDKPEIVGKLLQSPAVGKMMIFTHTKRSAQRLADELSDRGFDAAAIHGDLHQSARERTLKKFRRGNLKVLVATDVAARGIDVESLTHVVNYEVPDDPHQYVHRIGRTGRAGQKGVAVTLVDWQDVTRWKVINNELELPFSEPVETYSTSPHLLTDLQIPEDAKGSIPVEDRPERTRLSERSTQKRSTSRNRKRTHRRASSHDSESEARPQRTRTRRRRTTRRNGEVIERTLRDEAN